MTDLPDTKRQGLSDADLLELRVMFRNDPQNCDPVQLHRLLRRVFVVLGDEGNRAHELEGKLHELRIKTCLTMLPALGNALWNMKKAGLWEQLSDADQTRLDEAEKIGQAEYDAWNAER